MSYYYICSFNLNNSFPNTRSNNNASKRLVWSSFDTCTINNIYTGDFKRAYCFFSNYFSFSFMSVWYIIIFSLPGKCIIALFISLWEKWRYCSLFVLSGFPSFIFSSFFLLQVGVVSTYSRLMYLVLSLSLHLPL